MSDIKKSEAGDAPLKKEVKPTIKQEEEVDVEVRSAQGALFSVNFIEKELEK